MRPSSNLRKGLSTANPSLYCAEEDDDVPAAAPSASSAVSLQPASTPSAPPTAPDASTFDPVKAAQYGAYDRLRHLVEVEGVDPKKPGQE